MNKIIIVGATSGIGRALAGHYANAGWKVGITGRRKDLLESLEQEHPGQVYVECFDVTGNSPVTHLKSLIAKMEGMDLLLYNAGYGEPAALLEWQIEKKTVDTNVNGFIEIISYGFNYFVSQGHGHIASTSSIAAIRGSSYAPAYSASKAFQSNYLEGLLMKAKKNWLAIDVTDIQPGFVDTKMAKGNARFWVAPVQKASRQIYQALQAKKKKVFITRRWWIIAQVMKWMPDLIYHKIG